MDEHVHPVETLSGAVRVEFKRLETLCSTHDFLYEQVWRSGRADADRGPDPSLSAGRRCPRGKSAMPAGQRALQRRIRRGATRVGRLPAQFPYLAWIDPLSRARQRTPSIGMLRQLPEERMHPLTPDGLAAALDR